MCGLCSPYLGTGGIKGAPGTHAPLGGPDSFIFKQFLAKQLKNNSTFGSWRSPLGKILDPLLLGDKFHTWCTHFIVTLSARNEHARYSTFLTDQLSIVHNHQENSKLYQATAVIPIAHAVRSAYVIDINMILQTGFPMFVDFRQKLASDNEAQSVGKGPSALGK